MMNILIVEDEQPAYRRLCKMISELHADAIISEQVSSVAELKQWLEENPLPELAFMDIHLADGTSFELIENESFDFPVVFTTAYSEYALQAFKALSIDYLLKPVKSADLEKAFQSFRKFKDIFQSSYTSVKNPSNESYKKRFIVRFGENIRTISVEDIAYFFSKNKGTLAVTHDNRTYPIDYNLETVSAAVDPELFFRINRQYLIHINAIAEMKSYSKARVIIRLNPLAEEQPVVSSERAAAFKKWLGGD